MTNTNIMNHKLKALAVAVFAVLGLQAQTSFTLDEAIAYGLQNAHEIKLDELNISDADAQIKEYYALGIPQINANVNFQHALEIPTQVLPDFISPSVYNVLFDENLLPRRDLNFGGGIPAQFGVKNTLDAGVELQTLILDGSYFVGLRAQKLYKELVRREHETVQYDVKSKVTQAYMTCLNLRKNISLLNNNISSIDKIYSETKAIYESGFAEKLDVDRLYLSKKNLETERDNLTRLFDVSTLALKFVMGFPISDDITLTSTFKELADGAMLANLESLPALDLNNRTEVRSLNTAVELQDMNVKRLRYAYLPTLTGFINYGQTLQRNDLFDENDNDWFPRSIVGVNLSIPIFDGFDKKAKIQRAKISRENTLLQKSLFERSIELDVNIHYLSYLNAKEKVRSTKENLDLAENIYEITKIKFREGVGSSLEVTQAETEWYRSQTNYSAAQFELITTYNDLQTALGNL